MAVAHSLVEVGGGVVNVARMNQRRSAQATSLWNVRIDKRGSGRPKTLWPREDENCSME